MAEPKRWGVTYFDDQGRPHLDPNGCGDCDHVCEHNDDGECFGNLSREERIAIALACIRSLDVDTE